MPALAVTDRRALPRRLRVGRRLDLADHRPDERFGWDKEEAKAALPVLVRDVAELQKRLFAEGAHAVLLVLQAMDAAGKDGVLREVLTGLNPAGVAVHSFGVPSE